MKKGMGYSKNIFQEESESEGERKDLIIINRPTSVIKHKVNDANKHFG